MANSVKLIINNLSLIPKNITVSNYKKNQITTSFVQIGVRGFHRSQQVLHLEKMKNPIKLCQENLKLIPENITVPAYDRSKITASIVHIGVGGFHRSHQAYYAERLIAEYGINDCGICGIGLLPHDQKMYEIMKQQDCLYTLITKELDGTVNARIIGSIVEYLFAPENPQKVIEKMSSPEVKIISLTITEGGYNYIESSKSFNYNDPAIIKDIQNQKSPNTVFGYLARALKVRKEKGISGCSILSCDNIQGNGDMTKNMIECFIKLSGDEELLNWVNKNVTFPNSMVDRITPATFEADRQNLQTDFKILDQWPVVCESFIQWVIEDRFIAGRPAWELLGAQFVTDVVPYENMKLRLLNAGHTILGILGALNGYETIDEAARDKDLGKFLRSYMDLEATPNIAHLEGIDLDKYKDSLIIRFQNKYIKDQISRICEQSSSKIPKFILPVICDHLKKSDQIAERAVFLLAAWCRYNEGVDEKGKELVIDDDRKDELVAAALKARNEAGSFLELKIFSELSKNVILNKIFSKFLKNIREKGIKQCVKDMNY